MNKPIKLAFVGNSALTMINFRLGLMAEMVRCGYEVTMLTPADCDLTPCEQAGIRVIPVSVDCKGKNPYADLRLLHRLTAIYRRERFDFVFHYTIKPIIYGSIAARRCHLKQISVVTGLGYTFQRRNWLFFLSRAMHRYALREACQVWFLNNEDRDDFLNNGIVAPERVKVIHGEGVNTTHFAPEPLPANGFTFLYMGRMLYSKGVKLFVRAARRLRSQFPKAEWVLLGALDAQNPDAVSPHTMERWVQSGDIKYLGVTKDVVPYLRRASCVVLPSYYREGVPRVLMEAAAMTRPLIATDWVGCRDVVDDGVNGILCQPADEDSLVAAMQKMLSLSEAERVQMGQAGRKKVLEVFDERLIIQEYQTALKTFIG